jgi:ATP-dependent DNA helicase RecG
MTSKIVLEALHNCIAHQDYGRNGRVVVTEQPDRLIFANEGGFFEGAAGRVLSKVPRFLAAIATPSWHRRWPS